MNVALALGHVEEAMGRIDDGAQAVGNARHPHAMKEAFELTLSDIGQTLIRVRYFLLQEIASSAARVPVALYTPITAKEVEEAAP
jgi:hypothetical protein